MFVAVLDTCVLWPSLRRDFMLSLAIEGLYRPVWSDVILEELQFAEEEKLLRRGAGSLEARDRAARLVGEKQRYFADALVDDWSRVRPAGLPDPNDEHVLAAAVVTAAGVVVTENLKDFPRERVPVGIEVLHPSDFARDAVSVQPQFALFAVEEMARRRRSQTPGDLLDLLERRYGMTAVAELIRSA